MHARFKKRQRVIIGPALHILRQPNERRSAIRRVQHGRKRGWQRLNHLCGMRDPVPKTRYRLECVIHAQRWISEVLKLLQHWVRQAGQKGISAQHQNRQAVRMCQRSGRQQIRGPRPCTCRAEHESLSQPGFCIPCRRKSHALFVLAPIQRQFMLVILQGLTKTSHIAMTKNAKAAATNAMLFPIDFNVLRFKIAHDRLCRCQRNG